MKTNTNYYIFNNAIGELLEAGLVISHPVVSQRNWHKRNLVDAYDITERGLEVAGLVMRVTDILSKPSDNFVLVTPKLER